MIKVLGSCLLLMSLTVLSPVARADSDTGPGMAPVPGALVGAFAPPSQPWLPGHRGVDLAATEGETVVAAAGGVISFAGQVAGRSVVVVTHGVLRTTYEPVLPAVTVGQHVAKGQALGTVQRGHQCAVAVCLHWGLRQGEAYLDPMRWVRGGIRLLPAGAANSVGVPLPSGVVPMATGRDWVAPATGPVSSRFGMRLHPVLGVWKMHDGTDIAAACGSTIRASATGRVTSIEFSPGYGNRLRITHLTDSGVVVTGYAHAESFSVAVGEVVVAGQQIGFVGSTGLSTGCHLHAQAWRSGTLIDPWQLWGG